MEKYIGLENKGEKMIFSSLYSGSSGNSIFIKSDEASILIDAGMSGKSIESALKEINQDPKALDGIFITHEHSDHIKGVGILSRKYNLPIYANLLTWNSMEPSLGKVKDENKRILTENCIYIKDMLVTRFNTPHDAVAPSGYTAESGGKKVAVVTDLGHFSNEVREAIKDCDVILIESNHDVEMVKFGPYPYHLKRRVLSNIGHLSNEDCGRAIVDILGDKHKTIILGHLSNNNNYPDLAYETVKNVLIEEGVIMETDITLTLARRDMPSGYIEF